MKEYVAAKNFYYDGVKVNRGDPVKEPHKKHIKDKMVLTEDEYEKLQKDRSKEATEKANKKARGAKIAVNKGTPKEITALVNAVNGLTDQVTEQAETIAGLTDQVNNLQDVKPEETKVVTPETPESTGPEETKVVTPETQEEPAQTTPRRRRGANS